MPSLADILGTTRGVSDLSDLRSSVSRDFGIDRRKRPRLSLNDTAPDDLADQIMERVRNAPAEDVYDGPHGGLQYALELLDLPRNAVANLANTIIGAPTDSKYRAFGLPKVSAGDLLKQLGWTGDDTASSVGRGVAGFLGDVATDPLTYLTFGAGGLLGQGGRKIGQRAFTQAGAKAVEAETAARLAGLGENAGETLRELHQTQINTLRRGAGLGEQIERAAHPLARDFSEQEGRRIFEEQVAGELADKSPELLNRNRIGVSTQGLKHFGLLDLPYALGTIPARVLAPGAMEAVDRVAEPLLRATRPFSWIPEASATLVEKGGPLEQTLGKAADAVGLGRVARAAAPIVEPIGQGLREAGRQAWQALSNEPVSPRPGDAADALRYDAQKWEQFVKQRSARRGREIVVDEPAKLNAYIARAADQTGLDAESIIKPAIFALKERIPSMQAGKVTGQEVADAVREIVQRGGGTDEQAAKLASFLRGESPLADLAPAYHASPHRFPEFSLHGMGTGEGVQAYGWGLYFADDKEVAKWYKEKFAAGGPTIDGARGKFTNDGIFEIGVPRQHLDIGEKWALGEIRPHDRSIDDTINRLRRYAEDARKSAAEVEALATGRNASSLDKDWFYTRAKRERAELLDRNANTLDALRERIDFSNSQTAPLYNVDLQPQEHEYLDWDLPLTKQSPTVRKALRKIGIAQRITTPTLSEAQEMLASPYAQDLRRFESVRRDQDILQRMIDDEDLPGIHAWFKANSAMVSGDYVPAGATGGQVYNRISNRLGGDRAASEALRDAGVRGIRYLDGNSRRSGTGSYNRVIFDPKDIRIDLVDLAPDYDLFGNPITPKVTQRDLFGPEHFEPPQRTRSGDPVPVSDGLRQMVAEVLPTIPGKKRPDAQTVRNALIDRYGSAAVHGTMLNGLRTPAGVDEIDEAIDLANKGGYLFAGLPDLAPQGRKIGDPVEMVDSDLNSYEGKLQIVDESQLLASHRPVKYQGKVTSMEADPAYPVGFQARDRAQEASVKQVAGIAANPRPSLLIEHGVEVTGGPPVVWQPEGGAPVVIQGNGRVAGMRAWNADQWKQYRDALTERGYDIPEGVTKPVLVRSLQGDEDAARKLAALGQESGALKQRRIEQARATLNALGVSDIDQVPPVRIDEPISRDNVRHFIENPANRDFREWLFSGLTPQRREQIMAAPEELADKVQAVFLASLPPNVQRVAATAPREIEDMFVAAAPAAAYMHSLARTGQIHAVYDLHGALEQGAALFERLRTKGGSYKRIIDQLDELAETRTFAGMGDDIAATGLRGLAVAVGLTKAARSTNPTETLLNAFNKIIAAAKADDPNQMAMFAIDSSEQAARAYLHAFLPEKQAESLMSRMSNIGRIDAQNVVTKTEAPRPPTGREQFLRDMEPIFASQQLSDADKALRREVLSRFSDDAFRGLRIQQGTPEQAEQIIAERAKAGLPPQTPAAAYYDQRAIAANLSAAEQADLDARGLIRLFENSAKHTDFGLVLEEMAHHGYKSILPQADRALIDKAYAARPPEEWAKIFRDRGHGAAEHYAGSANEWFSRQAADFVMGHEINANPQMKSIFTRLWEKLAEIWRTITGRRRLELDPRVEAVIGRWYRKPEPTGSLTPAIAEATAAAPEAARPLTQFAEQGNLIEPLPPQVGVSPEAEAIPQGRALGQRPFQEPQGVSPEAAAIPQGRAVGQQPFETPQGVSPEAEAIRPPEGVAVQPKMRMVTQAGEPGTLDVSDPVQQMLDYMDARELRRTGEEKALGIYSPELQTDRVMGYLKRYTTQKLMGDAKSKVGQLMRSASMGLSGEFQGARHWKLREKFADEVNKLVASVNDVLAGHAQPSAETTNVIREFNLAKGDRLPFYSMDPVVAHVGRELESVRAIGSAEFLHELARRYGTRIAQDGHIPPGMVKAQADKFGDITREFVFAPPIAKLIESHVKQLEDSRPILRAYDWLLGKWKGLALMSPAYHLRNLFGNVWNAKLLDAFDPRSWNEARFVQQAVASGKGLERKIAGTDYTIRQLYRKMLVDHGLIGSGFFGIETRVTGNRVREILEDSTKPAAFARVAQELRGMNPLKANGTLGQIGEEMSKIGAVISRLRKGDSLEQAVATTKKALFDYGDLTDFERKTLRRVMPFYSWTRKNAELLLQVAATKPATLSMIPKLQLNIEREAAGDDQLPPSLRPAHIAKEGGIQISGGMNPRFLNAGYMLPLGELNLLNPLAPATAANQILDQIGGPAGLAVDLATNYDRFFDRPIREYPGQTKDFLGVSMPPEAKHVLRSVRPLNMAQQWIDAGNQSDSAGSAAATIGAQLGGVRVFPVDVRRQVLQADQQLTQQSSLIKRDIRRRAADIEKSGGDPATDAELRRLVAMHDQAQQERASLPAKEARALTNTLSPNRKAKLATLMEQARAAAEEN